MLDDDVVALVGHGDRGKSLRQSWAMRSSSLALWLSPLLASAVMDAQAALSSSCFAMSRGGGGSSSSHISPAWCMYSSDNVLMRENASLNLDLQVFDLVVGGERRWFGHDHTGEGWNLSHG